MHFPVGQASPVALAPCSLLLAGANTMLGTERFPGDRQACWPQHGTGHPAQTQRGGADSREQQHSGLRSKGLVCPGCGRSGVRGGVRCSGGVARANGGEQQFEQHGTTQTAVLNHRIQRAALRTDENENLTNASVEESAADWARKPEEYATQRHSPTHVSSPADCVAAAGGTFRTSLGVVVDICTWRQQGGPSAGEAVREDGDVESNERSSKRPNGEYDRLYAQHDARAHAILQTS